MQILLIDDEFCALGLALQCFHRIDELRYAFRISEESIHDLLDMHRVNVVKAQTKPYEMVQEFEGGDIGVESVRVIELLVPFFVNNGHDEFLAGIIGRLIELTIIYLCLVFSL